MQKFPCFLFKALKKPSIGSDQKSSPTNSHMFSFIYHSLSSWPSRLYRTHINLSNPMGLSSRAVGSMCWRNENTFVVSGFGSPSFTRSRGLQQRTTFPASFSTTKMICGTLTYLLQMHCYKSRLPQYAIQPLLHEIFTMPIESLGTGDTHRVHIPNLQNPV